MEKKYYTIEMPCIKEVDSNSIYFKNIYEDKFFSKSDRHELEKFISEIDKSIDYLEEIREDIIKIADELLLCDTCENNKNGNCLEIINISELEFKRVVSKHNGTCIKYKSVEND